MFQSNPFTHRLGQTVKVTISGEQGCVKARADYTNSANQYLIHYLAADGRAVDAWFDESELTPVQS